MVELINEILIIETPPAIELELLLLLWGWSCIYFDCIALSSAIVDSDCTE